MPVLKKIKSLRLYATLIACTFFLSSLNPPSREYQVKAVFLFNFTQFVEWPSNAFSAGAPMVIGILGDDPFGSYLDETVSGENVNGHPLVIQRYRKIEDVKSCHVLFISTSETNNIEQIVASLKGRSILTVSDTPGFIQQGGIIRFFTSNNKIQFQINPEAARAAGLSISSKLLRLAEIKKK
ncbi:MAG TPA: YfiR family protein [Cytophagaceae bacterium]|jgi:hypothetical protein|nr:YfiR family protein [Cytophagaceae bacterium]